MWFVWPSLQDLEHLAGGLPVYAVQNSSKMIKHELWQVIMKMAMHWNLVDTCACFRIGYKYHSSTSDTASRGWLCGKIKRSEGCPTFRVTPRCSHWKNPDHADSYKDQHSITSPSPPSPCGAPLPASVLVCLCVCVAHVACPNQGIRGEALKFEKMNMKISENLFIHCHWNIPMSASITEGIPGFAAWALLRLRGGSRSWQQVTGKLIWKCFLSENVSCTTSLPFPSSYFCTGFNSNSCAKSPWRADLEGVTFPAAWRMMLGSPWKIDTIGFNSCRALSLGKGSFMSFLSSLSGRMSSRLRGRWHRCAKRVAASKSRSGGNSTCTALTMSWNRSQCGARHPSNKKKSDDWRLLRKTVLCSGSRRSALSSINRPFCMAWTLPKMQRSANLRPGAETYRAISTRVAVRPNERWQYKTTTRLWARCCSTVSIVSSRPTKSSTWPGSAEAESIASHLDDASGEELTSMITSSAECSLKPLSNPSGSVAWTSANAILKAFFNDLLQANAR